ncbi:MAG: hypothetical protein KGP14_09400 [Betaproteobacteria bacterium]|nr:hypothetical protein [Betaproteobacteria bacterium]
MTSSSTCPSATSETPFLGLAPFLRHSIAGLDLMPDTQTMLAQAEINPHDANLWMNLSTAMLCLGHRDLGLSIQAQALGIQRIFALPARQQPAQFRLLMLMTAGDLAENTPLDCLLENSDVDLIYYYITPESPLVHPIPEHDAVMVGIGDSSANQSTLAALAEVLADWPKPVINSAQHIPNTDRGILSQLLQGIPGLLIPSTLHVTRQQLEAVATGRQPLESYGDIEFPIIVRPIGSQAGRNLERLTAPGELTSYLAQVGEPDFFVARFIDYSSRDGRFRKYRIAIIDGHPFACHMAVSSHWMIHYVNAGMYDDPAKRNEEARWMAGFDAFAARHGEALATIHQRLKLDYFCIDCAETEDGQLLIFEADHVMVVHAMDQVELFPYKHQHMAKVSQAFRAMLLSRSA